MHLPAAPPMTVPDWGPLFSQGTLFLSEQIACSFMYSFHEQSLYSVTVTCMPEACSTLESSSRRGAYCLGRQHHGTEGHHCAQ